MARYGTQHKEANSSAHRRDGWSPAQRDGTLMADAGLTNGAFYAHFRSKDDLIASVVEEELRLQAAWVDALPTGRAGVEQLVRAYIAPEHRDYPDAGCPSAALLDELGRSDVVTNGRRPGSRRARHSQPAGGCAVCMSIAIQWFAGRGWDCR